LLDDTSTENMNNASEDKRSDRLRFLKYTVRAILAVAEKKWPTVRGKSLTTPHERAQALGLLPCVAIPPRTANKSIA
jgi:hypothetical protein